MPPPSCTSPYIKLPAFPRDPHLPPLPPCTGGGAPPNQGGVGQGHEDRRWEGGHRRAWMHCGGGDCLRVRRAGGRP